MKQLNWLMSVAVAAILTPAVHAETYEIDPDHCEIGFSVKHLGINMVRGNFSESKGNLAYDEAAPLALQAQATIQSKSIGTGIKKRDDHLRSPDFFDVEKFPEIVFVSKSLEKQEEELMLTGTLVIKGVSKDVILRCQISGPIDSPFEPGVRILGLNARGKINRKDFGVGSEGPVDKLISEDVKIEVNLEAKKKP